MVGRSAIVAVDMRARGGRVNVYVAHFHLQSRHMPRRAVRNTANRQIIRLVPRVNGRRINPTTNRPHPTPVVTFF